VNSTKYMLIDISGGQQLFSGNGMPVRDLPLPGKEALARSMVLYLPVAGAVPTGHAGGPPSRPPVHPHASVGLHVVPVWRTADGPMVPE